MQTISPITGIDKVSLIYKYNFSYLQSKYLNTFNIDINYLLGDCKELYLYKCNDSGFRFYYPHDIVGDSKFYHQLEQNDWYYMSTKWEFDEAIKYIKPKDSVLEIGSGKGDFLNSLTSRVDEVKCVGLELNHEATKVAKLRGINVISESSYNHAKNNYSKYDVITLFQVLEHIPNPMCLLKDTMQMLKIGGLLIIGVPDNSTRASDSIFVKQDNILNMPPHHQGLWDTISLSFLPKVLPVKLEYLVVEPATASHHANNYRGLLKEDLFNRFGNKFGLLLYHIGRPFYKYAINKLKKYLPGHSILAIYRKIV